MRAVLVLSAVLVAGPVWAEPVVQGLPLSSWIGRLKERTPLVHLPNSGRAVVIRGGLRREVDPRAAACAAIGELGVGGAPAIPTLVELIRGGNDECATAAKYALSSIGPPAVPALTRLLALKQA